MRMKIIAILMLVGLLLSGCEAQIKTDGETTAAPVASADPSDLFSGRDFEVDYDKAKCIQIDLNGNSVACTSDAVHIEGSTVTISDEGTYILTGTLDNGMIIVDTDKKNKVQIVLDTVDIHCESSAPIYVRQADKVFLTLAAGTDNSLSAGVSFESIDDNNIDGVVFSKDDLTLNGHGCLTITSPAGNGIVSKDELTITSGSYTVHAASHGLEANDSICITNANLIITTGKDGMHAENGDKENLGFVYIDSGTFTVTSEGDGISASSYMQIQSGTFSFTCGGGSANGQKQTSDNWGEFFGGGHGGGRPGGRQANASAVTDADSTSIKGIKAGSSLTINGGSFAIDSADDAIHANGDVTIIMGDLAISSGDDGIHADGTLTVNGGTLNIAESYEGLEALNIGISGGDLTITATDDGMNAAGGNDQSGFGGFRGGDRFGGSSNGAIRISGGTVYIHASGDGIDSNGKLEISGGTITVCGPTRGDTSVLDYDTTGVITGGTFIGTGSSMMAQLFTASENQGVIALNVGNRTAGTCLTVKDSGGNDLITYTPEESFVLVILSSPEIIKGEDYTICVGTDSGTFEAS